MKLVLDMLLVAVLLPATAAIAAPDLVVLVRHAEKSTEPADDPTLSAAGRQRADALAQALDGAGVTAIITTQFRRTRETAQPLAERLQLQPTVVAARKGEAAAHLPEVLATIRQQSGTVLVVGHSNTVAAIATALGAPPMADFCETTFGRALVVRPRTGGAALLRLSYGAADAAPQPGCQ